MDTASAPVTSGPAGAKLFDGVWLPADETHLVDMLDARKVRVLRLPDDRPCYQRHKYLALLDLLPADRRRVFVDVGAHVGLWSMQAECDFAQVIAFEPVALHAEIFPHNVRGRQPRVRLHRVALGVEAGRVSLGSHGASTGDTHVTGDGDIPMVTLDAYDLQTVDAMKIDVEGFELPVVRGAVETLLRCRPLVVIEQKAKERDNFGSEHQEALRYLKTLGMIEVRPEITGDHFLGWA